MKKRISVTGFACVLIALAAVSTRAQTPQVINTYAAKFICGVQKDTGINSMPDAQAGRYSSKINVHNNTGIKIDFRKKIIRLPGSTITLLQGKGNPTFKVNESLEPDQALEVVCRDIYQHLNIPIAGQMPPYIEGFVIFEVFTTVPTQTPPVDPLDVEGIYTYRGDLPGAAVPTGVSISVVVYPAKSNKHILQ